LAPKIERHRDSFLAGQLYDELENYAELHGAEREFKQMMAGARNRAHMEYDTNPGGFQNWFWFLPFENDVNEGLMKEPTNRKEYLDQRDRLFRMMAVDSNPANKQIIKQALQDLETRYGNLKNTVKEAEEIPAKMVMQSFVVEYNPATKTVTISKRNQKLDRFQFKGVPSLGSFQRTVNNRIKNLEDDLYGDSNEAGAVSSSRVKIPGRGYGYQDLDEESTTSSEAVEIAVIKRILVAHTDLIMEFGLDKVTQAIEEVAYNVGDVDEIGTSDVSAYVHQVKQILGVPEDLDEKWSAKYKSSINCANPKGFSQKAHCAGKKK
jgi:hypothetical protein